MDYDEESHRSRPAAMQRRKNQDECNPSGVAWWDIVTMVCMLVLVILVIVLMIITLPTVLAMRRQIDAIVDLHIPERAAELFGRLEKVVVPDAEHLLADLKKIPLDGIKGFLDVLMGGSSATTSRQATEKQQVEKPEKVPRKQ